LRRPVFAHPGDPSSIRGGAGAQRLLFQMQMVPKASMATKEQLMKIFALEAEAMREEIDALDRAAKRSGTLRDPSQREADRQVGAALTAFSISPA
jgi:hypothetical protein